MRKLIVWALTGALTLSLTACGGQSARDGAASAEPVQEAVSPLAELATSEEPGGTSEQTADNGERSGTLIVYFSAANTSSVDTVTSATPIIDENSATGLLVEYIHDEVGGDVVEIVPTVAYPDDYDGLADFAKKEVDQNTRPAFEPLEVDPTTYKTVFIGYPVWWYTLPMVMETFFDTYDFSGVTIVPFNTHEGSGDGGTYGTIKEREPNAAVLDGFAVRGGDVGKDDTKTAVAEWISGLNLE